MAITFKTTRLENTGSPLYQAEAIDENGNILMTWQVAVNEGDNLEEVVAEGYAHAIAPPVYVNQEPAPDLQSIVANQASIIENLTKRLAALEGA